MRERVEPALLQLLHALEGAPNDIDARCANSSIFNRMTAGPASALALSAADKNVPLDELEPECLNAALHGAGYGWFLGPDVRHVWAWYAFWAALPWASFVLVGAWCVCRVAPPRSPVRAASMGIIPARTSASATGFLREDTSLDHDATLEAAIAAVAAEAGCTPAARRPVQSHVLGLSPTVRTSQPRG